MVTMNEKQNQKQHIVIITGLSGAGKTGVMRALEDIGFYCIDNLPVALLPTLLTLTAQMKHLGSIALGIDARSEQFLTHLIQEIEHLKKNTSQRKLTIIFLKAHDNTLVKRFQATRRAHPLAQNIGLTEAIAKERILLTPIMSLADITLDTDTFTIHGLREWVRTTFSHDEQRKLLVTLISFGLKYGIPTECNLLFDLRFLPNPYFIPELKPLDGRNPHIAEYLFSQDVVCKYWKTLLTFVQTTLKHYVDGGHIHISIGIGCTGGKHRSVAFVEKMHNTRINQVTTLINHRDITKE